VSTDQSTRAESGYRSLFQRIPVALYRSTPDGAALAVNPAMVEMLRYPDAETLLREPVQDRYVDPADRQRFRHAMERDGSVFGFEARLRRRDGSVIWIRDSARAVTDEDGGIMYFEGAIVDVTDEKHAEDQLRRQAGELSALHDTTLGLIEHLDGSRLLDDILSRAAALLDTEHAYLYLVDRETEQLVIRSGLGRFHDLREYRLKKGEGLAGRVWQTGEPYAVEDYHRWSNRLPEFDFIRAAIGFPLVVGSEVVGVIGLIRTEGAGAFNTSEMGLVSRFARMASLALTNARLYEAARHELAERRRVEDALRASETGYRQLFEANPQPMWVYDLKTLAFLAVNHAAEAHYGYTREEFLAMTIKDIRPPEDVPELVRDVSSTAETFRRNRVWRHRKKDGALIDVVIASHVIDWQGRRARLVLATDVTDRLKAEEALRKSEQRYRTLVETSSEWIWSVDLDGRHTSSNSAIRDILGYEPEEILGLSSLDLMHPEDRREVQGWFPTAVAERRGWSNMIIRWRHKDGSYRWLESNGVPIFDEAGELAGYWGADRDVTARVRAGDDRRRLLGELVRLQEEERRRIASDIHDDPVQAMTAVEMRLETLRLRMKDADGRKTLEQLTLSVSAAIARLRRLLVELRPPRLDREGLASAIRSLLDRLRDETGIAVALEDRSLHEIPVDARTVLYRITQEALTNVRKHAEAASVKVGIAERDGGVLLRIRDDGRGFDPARTAEERPGHLGLVSMRERAELADGKFRISSVPGDGTTVDVWVPAGEQT
jgi:PAS domain S-box-containing protein